MRISNADLQRVYLQTLRHKAIRVPSHILAELIKEIARSRGVHLYDLGQEPQVCEQENVTAWAGILDILKRFKGRQWTAR